MDATAEHDEGFKDPGAFDATRMGQRRRRFLLVLALTLLAAPVAVGTDSAEESPSLSQLEAEAMGDRPVGTGETIDIPQPRDASEGRYVIAGEDERPFPFRWLPADDFQDAWGRDTEAAALVHEAFVRTRIESTTGPLGEKTIEDDAQERLIFAGPDWRPQATTDTVHKKEGMPAFSSSGTHWQVRYDAEPSFWTCLFRNPLQGSPMPAGKDLDRGLCPGSEPVANLTWWTGPLEQHRGMATIALYGVDDPTDASTTVKVRWAHGIAHPIELEIAEHGDDGEHQSLFLNLTYLAPNGTPVDDLGSETRKPTVERAPQHALSGPQLTDTSRFPFPLAEASQTARGDPSLEELQAILDGEAALAGAALAPSEPADTREARELVWALAFTNPREGPVYVECRRPMVGSGPTSMAAPIADCRETDDPPTSRLTLDRVPQLGASDLAARSATWDEALDRWSQLDPANASAPVTRATYLPGVATLAEVRSTIELGTGGEDASTTPANSPKAPTTVSLAPEDGRTQAYRTGVERTTLTDSSGGVQASPGVPGTDRIGLVSDTDRLVGAASIGLLGILSYAGFALYSRLREGQVLGHPTRRQILDLVRDRPGIHANAIAREVEANEHTVDHHLRVLRRADVLVLHETDGYNHYFDPSEHPPDRHQALAALQRGQARSVYEQVRKRPGTDLSTLADHVGISQPYASQLVDELVEAGLVDRGREGRCIALYATEATG